MEREEHCRQTSPVCVGSARSGWATLGLPRSQRVCFPVCTAQAPGCSAGNCLKWALGYVHFPGLSHSFSGSQVLHKAQTRLCLRFVLFPGPSSSGDQVLGSAVSPGGGCVLSPPCPSRSASWVTAGAPSQVCRVSPLGSRPLAATLLADVNRPEFQEVFI